MNVSAFTSLLKHPGKVSEEEVHALEKVVEAYPYFQSVRALYLKALKHQDSFKYNTALKHTAAYTADRAVLFDFITSEVFSQHTTAESISKQQTAIADLPVQAEELIVEPVDRKEAEAVLDPELFHPKPRETEPKEAPPETRLQLGKPLEFNPEELHSFTTWLTLTLPPPVERKGVSGERQEKKKKQREKFERIDKFIARHPRIIPRKEIEPLVNLAEVISFEQTGLMTETLARVYVEQKKFKKAIQAYKILSLKYPEKSGFFADQIKAIQKLQQT